MCCAFSKATKAIPIMEMSRSKRRRSIVVAGAYDHSRKKPDRFPAVVTCCSVHIW